MTYEFYRYGEKIQCSNTSHWESRSGANGLGAAQPRGSHAARGPEGTPMSFGVSGCP